jgi:hypothetical protein
MSTDWPKQTEISRLVKEREKEKTRGDKLEAMIDRMSETIVDLRAERQETLEILKQCEWDDYDKGDKEMSCSFCERTIISGHAPDCRLAAHIKKLEQK